MEKSTDQLNDIAIIGMAGRFPGARNIEEFWENLANGVESIRSLSDQELLSSGIASSLLRNPAYVKSAAVLDDVELFDAGFFGMSPRDAEITDPQHRIFLECCWEALENGGYDPGKYQGSIGVYAGANVGSYLLFNLYSNSELVDSHIELPILLGNDKDYLTTRVSYKLNLKGPSVAVQTACSSSLVSVHMACESLLASQCEMALAGGVSIVLPKIRGYLYQENGIWSPDGHCRAFDADSEGTIFGNGAGVVLLKRLEEALADGDHIYAVIKGSAINNDGSEKIGYTAPSVGSQSEVIAEAIAVAGVDAETISYVETHGTGTQLGDPIEIEALTRAFKKSTSNKGYCAIGSVKTNIGHLDTAAGIAGLIKTALALKHRMLPPSLHFRKPNPKIDFENSPFYVNASLSPWKKEAAPRRAGVSSFGMGGTNAHVVLEEAPQARGSSSRPFSLVLLSARSDQSLQDANLRFSDCLRKRSDLNMADVAFTYQAGRRAFDHRQALVCDSLRDALQALEDVDSGRIMRRFSGKGDRPIGFMFSGQGAQYVGMGQDLYRTEKVFREWIDRCSEILKPHLELDLREVIYPLESGKPEGESKDADQAATRLKQTAIAQPALFAVEYALAQVWMDWGIVPQAMIGHSIGEYVAACLAGVFSVEEGLRLVAARGRLMQGLTQGAMLAVNLPEDKLTPLLGERLSLAAVNAPSLCVVSGTADAVASLESQFQEKDVQSRRLQTSHAFHSEMMDTILQPFTEIVGGISLSQPNIPYISNLTGTWVTTDQVTHPEYWANHLRRTVRFADGMGQMLQEPNRILLEVGPGTTLCTLARQHPLKDKGTVVVPSMRHPQKQESDIAFLLQALGEVWSAGSDVDWSKFYAQERRCRLPLPTYPFERKRHWIEPKRLTQAQSDSSHAGAAQNSLHVPGWRQMPLIRLSPDALQQRRSWMVFMGPGGFSDRLIAQLKEQQQDVIAVRAGSKFDKKSDGAFTIRPGELEGYEALFKQLDDENQAVDKVLHLWSAEEIPALKGQSHFDRCQEYGYYSLLHLARVLGKQSRRKYPSIGVISSQILEVNGDEDLSPDKGTVLGISRVIPQEHPGLNCWNIDISPPEPGTEDEKKLIESLVAELIVSPEERVVAYRGNVRWVPAFKSLPLAGTKEEDSNGAPKKLRKEGVYLITGGLGRIGLELAEFLAKEVRAKLVLTGRSAFPDRSEWEEQLNNHGIDEKTGQQIGKLLHIESLGSEVACLQADVADQSQMKCAIQQTIDRFGGLNGVIHAAGVVEAQALTFLQATSKSESERHFHPKVRGLMSLERALRGRNLDFCQVVSSISVILGGLGHAAYSAANAYMDLFVRKLNGTLSKKLWTTVNWDSWRFPDLGLEEGTRWGGTAQRIGIEPDEGQRLFRQILSLENTQQVIVASNLEARIREWVALEGPDRADAQQGLLPARETTASNGIEKTLMELWKELLGVERLTVRDDFFDLGGHSLLAVQFFSEIEKRFGKKFPVATLVKSPTIETLSKVIEDDKPQAEKWSSLVEIQNGGERPPLFCVHGAGGNVLLYRDLARHLGLDQPFYGLQAQGLDGRKEPFANIQDMAAHYLQEIRRLQPQGPYYLGGYCMGGTVAFEMAQQLATEGERVAYLALFDTQCLWSNDKTQLIRYQALQILQQVLFHFGNFLLLGPRNMAAFVSAKLRVAHRRSKRVVLARMGWALSKLRPGQPPPLVLLKKVNDKAAIAYLPQPYSGPIAVFRPRKLYAGYAESDLGWAQVARGKLEVFELPVYPGGMMAEPFVRHLARKVKSSLDEAYSAEMSSARVSEEDALIAEQRLRESRISLDATTN